MNLKEYKKAFDLGVLAQWQNSVVVPEHLESLWDPLWPILGEGKRIRGYLAEVGLGNLNGESKLGVALELLHAFALVHDDIMDRSDMRRGNPAVHMALGKEIENSHTGVSYGILLGDWLLVESYGILEDFFEESEVSFEIRKVIRRDFKTLLKEMVFGQMMDIALESDRNLSGEYIIEKTKLKTALYTFARPLMLGLEAAGASVAQTTWAMEWGTAVGLGFQIQDDFLDLMGDPEKTGKPSMTDISEDSGTFFRWWILENGTEDQKALLVSFLGQKEITMKDKKCLRDMFEACGVIDEGKKLIEQYYEKGRNMLENSPLSGIQNEALSHILDILLHRSA